MKYGKKIAIFMGIGLFCAVGTMQARIVQFDELMLRGSNSGKDAVTVLSSMMDNAVVYIGATYDSAFKQTAAIIQKVCKEYPDILFMKIDADSYPSLKISDGKQQIRFYGGKTMHTVTKIKSAVELRALLKKYYR